MDIREIARRAKVSTATVSRAINHIRTVDPLLAKRVWKVVDELGYFPNTQARALVSGGGCILGWWFLNLPIHFFPRWCRLSRTWPWKITTRFFSPQPCMIRSEWNRRCGG